MPTKAMSLRLDQALAEELAMVARVDEMPISDVVREAVAKHIAERRIDPVFQKRLKVRLEQDHQIFDRLSD